MFARCTRGISPHDRRGTGIGVARVMIWATSLLKAVVLIIACSVEVEGMVLMLGEAHRLLAQPGFRSQKHQLRV